MSNRYGGTYSIRRVMLGDGNGDGVPEIEKVRQEERLFRLLVAQATRAILNDPRVRACDTCAHYRHKPCCDYANDGCGCKGLSVCTAGAFLSWRSSSGSTYDPEGWWTATIDHRVNCPAHSELVDELPHPAEGH